jgi:hypothetical protein
MAPANDAQKALIAGTLLKRVLPERPVQLSDDTTWSAAESKLRAERKLLILGPQPKRRSRSNAPQEIHHAGAVAQPQLSRWSLDKLWLERPSLRLRSQTTDPTRRRFLGSRSRDTDRRDNDKLVLRRRTDPWNGGLTDPPSFLWRLGDARRCGLRELPPGQRQNGD